MSDDRDGRERNRATIERAVQACYSSWAETYFDQYYSSPTAYPPVHQEIIRHLLAEVAPGKVLDAGCGPGSMLRGLTGLGLDLFGFDLTVEMVDEARRVMAPSVAEEHLWQGSVVEPSAYLHTPYDAAMCIGVLPHIEASDDDALLCNLHGAVRPGGLVILEARNQLFSLFTLNRYSREFFLSELIRPETLADADGAALAVALAELDERFRLDLPNVRRGTERDPGYDEVLSRTHNPLVFRQQMEAAGFERIECLFYHYHALPPMLEQHFPEMFRVRSLALENPRDWRGHFMASAFLMTGRRAE